MRSPSQLSFFGLTLLAVLVLPPLGAALAGNDLRGLLAFPPPVRFPTDSTRFSWWAVAAVVAVVATVALAWLRATRRLVPDGSPSPGPARALPAWGWAALGWTAAWWVLAWTRFPWFAPLQSYTFFPLWLGFIVAVNAFVQRQTGSCLLQRAPARWAALFGASALFWWVFEWLNRFVLNWHYLGVESFTATRYALHASVCFSTVLPAVAAVAEAIETSRCWTARTVDGPACAWLRGRRAGGILIAAGALALLLTGAWPSFFYPALWTAPAAVMLGLSVRSGRSRVTTELASGDWRRVAAWMLAALLCGVFWELWNWRSAPKWIYTVPGVDRWHVFEMPLLGYAGYLPFGLECLLVAEQLGLVSAGAYCARRSAPAAVTTAPVVE